jgi:hypothetical protein
MRRLLCLLSASLLAGCAAIAPPPAFELRLAPASLGHELALRQRMTVSAQGRSQQLEVAVEADADAVRLALIDFGQAVARLEWDGRTLQESRAPGVPAAVSGARVLTDLQLVHWPAEAVRAALPAGWSLVSINDSRLVFHGQVLVVRVDYPAPGTAELENVAGGYRLRLEAAAP